MANLAALIKKKQQEAIRKAQQDAAARKAQQDAARKAHQDALAAAAEKKRIEALDKANKEALDKAKQEALDKAKQKAIDKAKQKDIIKTPEILNNRISQPVSISTIGNEIQKQKQQIDTNLKLLTSAAITGSGLLAGGLTSFAKSSNGMNNNQTFSKENRTSVKNLYVIMPDANTNKKYIKNPNYKQFVTDYGCQIVPFKFYNKDAQLTEYEKFFNDNKSACVPMALAMDYFRKIQNDDE
jgi:hypothetical protein